MTTDYEPVDTVLTPREGGSGAWRDVKPGVYRAVVNTIVDTGVSAVYPDQGPQFQFEFALLDVRDEEGNLVTIRRWCTQKMTTGKKPSNLWLWAEAMGCSPKPGVGFAVSQLLNRECQIVIESRGQGDAARPTITTILQAAGGQQAEEPRQAPGAPRASDMDPCFVCDAAGEKFDSRGRSVCGKHAGATD